MSSETTSRTVAGPKANVWARRKARRALVQAVYQWQISATSLTGLREEFNGAPALKKADVDFFDAVLAEVHGGAAALDARFEPLLDRSIGDLDVVVLHIDVDV